MTSRYTKPCKPSHDSMTSSHARFIRTPATRPAVREITSAPDPPTAITATIYTDIWNKYYPFIKKVVLGFTSEPYDVVHITLIL